MRVLLILAVALVLHICLRRKAAATKCFLWQMALLAILVTPVASFIPVVTEPEWLVRTTSSVRSPSAMVHKAAGLFWPLQLIGSSLFLLKIALDLWAAYRLKQQSTYWRTTDGVALRTHGRVLTPMAWFGGGGAVLLPERCREMSAEALHGVIAHERAHLDRNDGWWLLLTRCAVALHWFNPLVWLAWLQYRKQMEWACDDAVLLRGTRPDDYAATLLSFAGNAGTSQTLPALSGSSSMEARFMHVLSENKDRAPLSARSWWMGILLLLALVLPSAAIPAGQTYSASDPGIQKPVLIHKVEPEYTDRAKSEKIEGPVLLRIEIDEQGATANQTVVKGLDPDLDTAAMQAISQWRFQPARKDGAPVRVSANVEVHFRLK